MEKPLIGVLTLFNLHTSGLYPWHGLTPPLPFTVAQFITPPPSSSRCQSMTFEKMTFLGWWQKYIYYIYDYFINKLTIRSLYQKSVINNNIFNKIEWMYWFNEKIVIGLQKKISKCYLNFNLNQINSWCINSNWYIQNKLCTESINNACFKLEERPLEVLKRINNFINVIVDKFAMSIRSSN